MFDTPKEPGRWQMPKLSMAQILVSALILSLGLMGYVFGRPSVKDVVVASGEANHQALSTPVINQQPGVVNLQNATNSVPADSTSLDVLMIQLQEMQGLLQTTSNQLEQKNQASGFLPSATPTMRPALVEENIPALWAEIDQLNQQMQPLMIQLETANANRSSRSASELAAMRTQVNTIHQRLNYLLSRVEAAQSRMNGMGSGNHSSHNGTNGLSMNATNPDRAAYQQLYQTMTELQTLLRQMQSQGTLP